MAVSNPGQSGVEELIAEGTLGSTESSIDIQNIKTGYRIIKVRFKGGTTADNQSLYLYINNDSDINQYRGNRLTAQGAGVSVTAFGAALLKLNIFGVANEQYTQSEATISNNTGGKPKLAFWTGQDNIPAVGSSTVLGSGYWIDTHTDELNRITLACTGTLLAGTAYVVTGIK